MFKFTLGQEVFKFANLVELMAKATPLRSGDVLAGVAAKTEKQRAVAQLCLAEVPLKQFLNEALVDYEKDEITRLIIDEHDSQTFKSRHQCMRFKRSI